MGKIICENHGVQIARSVSKFHQEKIKGREESQKAEIVFVELDEKEENIYGRFLVDPSFLMHSYLDKKVLIMQPDSTDFDKLLKNLKAACPLCVDEYLTGKV